MTIVVIVSKVIHIHQWAFSLIPHYITHHSLTHIAGASHGIVNGKKTNNNHTTFDLIEERGKRRERGKKIFGPTQIRTEIKRSRVSYTNPYTMGPSHFLDFDYKPR